LNKPVLIAALGGVIVTGVIVANVVLWKQEISSVEQTQKPGVVREITVNNPATENTLDQATSPTASSSVKSVPESLPSFDVVRVAPDGNALFAGRAVPGAEVIIYDGQDILGQLTADANGEWVFLSNKPISVGNRQFSLEMRVDGKPSVRSDDVVMLMVPENKPQKTAENTTSSSSSSENPPLANLLPGAGDAKTAKIKNTSSAVAIKLSRSNSKPIELLQKPSLATGTAAVLSVDVIDYDDQGKLSISGRAEKNRSVVLYLDNTYIGRVVADIDGAWQLVPEKAVDPGLYTLRADELNAAGKVIARLSFPFSRAEPDTGLTDEPFIIVQPGNSLWRLARRTYGKGLSYTLIYAANKDRIKNPDMIFPGQVFSIPTE